MAKHTAGSRDNCTNLPNVIAYRGRRHHRMGREAEENANLKQAAGLKHSATPPQTGDDEEDAYGLLPLATQQMRAARASAKAAMRARRATLDDGENADGDAGARGGDADRLHQMVRASADDHARWAANRARPTSPIGTGCADGTRASLASVHEMVYVCARCNGLVDGQAARTGTYAAGRLHYTGSDGCGSRVCSGNHRPGSFARGQRNMANALLTGRRRLARWPATTAHTHVWLASAEASDETARRVAAKHANIA